MNKLKHIEINIWKACNNKCRFCMSSKFFIENSWDDWEDYWLVNFQNIIENIRHYSDLWYKSIWFIWWDISIHPDIYKIIEESRKCWFQNINVVTNWMVFSNYEKAEKLVNSWVTRINISIHSHIDEIEDYLTQIKWWLQKKIQAIDNFVLLHNKWLLKDSLSINIVLNWLNYNNILKTCLYFYKNKWIKDIRINFLWNRFFASKEDKELLELSYTDFLPYLKQIIIFSLKSDLRITFDSIPACIFTKLWFENSDVIINKFLWEDLDHIEEISNLNKNQTFNWKEQKTNKLKTKFKKCNICSYFNSCQWIRNEYVEKYWNTEFNEILDINKLKSSENYNLFEELIGKYNNLIKEYENNPKQIFNSIPIKLNHYSILFSYILNYSKSNKDINVLEVWSYLSFFVDLLNSIWINTYWVEKNNFSGNILKSKTFFSDILNFNTDKKFDIIIAVNFFHQKLIDENKNLDFFIKNVIDKILFFLKKDWRFLFNFDNNDKWLAIFNIIKKLYPNTTILYNNICIINKYE